MRQKGSFQNQNSKGQSFFFQKCNLGLNKRKIAVAKISKDQGVGADPHTLNPINIKRRIRTIRNKRERKEGDIVEEETEAEVAAVAVVAVVGATAALIAAEVAVAVVALALDKINKEDVKETTINKKISREAEVTTLEKEKIKKEIVRETRVKRSREAEVYRDFPMKQIN